MFGVISWHVVSNLSKIIIVAYIHFFFRCCNLLLQSSESSSLYHKSYGIPNVGMTGDTVGFSMAQHNPPAYQYGTPKTGGTAYVAAPAYSGGQAVHKNKRK